eukprot:scaffold1362_cov125-Cylindrotheca_fusiformis.AAC.13
MFEIIEEWIIKEQGIDIWHEIKEKAGCATADQEFLRREYYQDEELVDVIAAASEVLDTSVPGILEAYGRYTFMHHLANGYDDLLQCQGSTLRQWLSNLNAMHDHIKQSFPGENFIAPIFWCEDCDEVEGSIILHYYSLRGTFYVPLVVGMIEELASYHFDIKVRMHQLALQNEGESSITTWRITAVDETQRWKLSPKAMGQQFEDKPVRFDSIPLPGKCPFSGKQFKKTDHLTSSNRPEKAMGQQFEDKPVRIDSVPLPSKCPFSGKEFKKTDHLTSSHGPLNVETSPKKCPWSPSEQEITSSVSSTAELSSTGDSVFQKFAETEENLGLSQTEMQEIFPFHILVDNAFHILQVGNLLPKVLKKKVEDFQGLHIQEVVQITR